MSVIGDISEPNQSNGASFKTRAEIASKVAAQHADAVDGDGRFPSEAFNVLKEQRLLGMVVPTELGGESASVTDVANVCYLLGRACTSTGMIFAMHQIMIVILARHARNSPWHADLLRRIAAEQWLVASSTTEGRGGGNLRSSSCAVEQIDSGIALTKSATVVSFGAEADAIMVTARRAADAQPSDQVLVALVKGDYELEKIVDWNALGMRGTRSDGFVLTARGGADQVLPLQYQTIHTQTMMPVAHLTWSSAWSGAAAGALQRARRFVRGAARQADGQLPPGAAHLTRGLMSLRGLRDLILAALQRYEAAAMTADGLDTLDFQTSMNLLKVSASEQAIATVMSAMQVCGIAGYRNDGEFSVGRHLRDLLSSAIMINNDRIIFNAINAAMLMDIP
jgi:acyl-CoA dehydrogenase